MTSFLGHQDNPFPPEDELPVGCTADGTPYDIGLTDDLESATFWDAQRIPSTNKFRISHTKYRDTYYLRYYNANRGWIASSTAGTLTLYRTLELDE